MLYLWNQDRTGNCGLPVPRRWPRPEAGPRTDPDQTLAGVAVLVGGTSPTPGCRGPPKGPRKPCPFPGRVPFTKAVMPAVRLAFIFAAWAAVILPDETAASMRVVASATRSLMIFWGSTFFDLASAAMLWPPCSAVFSSAGVMLRSLATTCNEAPPFRPKPKPGPRWSPPGDGVALGVWVGAGAHDRPRAPRKRPTVAPAARAAII